LAGCWVRGERPSVPSPSPAETQIALPTPTASLALTSKFVPTESPPAAVEEPLYFLSEDGLYVCTPDGRWVWRISDRAEGSDFAWSPDGRTLVFVCPESSPRIGDDELPCFLGPNGSMFAECHPSPYWDRPRVLCLMSADGWEMSELAATRYVVVGGAIDWSPDGEYLAFSGAHKLENWSSIFIVSRDGSVIRQLTDGDVNNGEPAWSPDGRWLAFPRWPSEEWTADDEEIFALDTACIYHEEMCEVQQWTELGWGTAPTWSPEGGELAFRCRWVHGEPSLCVASAGGANLRRVAEDVGVSFAWSPDGERIAIPCEGRRAICVLELASGQRMRLPLSTGRIGRIAWSADGTRLAFTARGEDRWLTQVFVVKSDGSGLVRVARVDGLRRIRWGPSMRTEGLELRSAARGARSPLHSHLRRWRSGL
jgi:Tol biopolymer transport system component